MSAADIMAVLMSKYLRYDFGNPENPNNDHLIFSKGHASPLLYSMYLAAGAIDEAEFLTYRTLGSRLEGHPTPRLPWVDVATGSLGQGLPIGVGIALSAARLEKRDYRVWVLCGDSEMTEGSIWEALDHAGHEKLGNLTAIVDVNRLGQRGETELGWKTEVYTARAKSFGWKTIVIDGHNLKEIDAALAKSRKGRQPTLIVARTIKGKGVSFVENKEGWHGKAFSSEEATKAIEELGGERSIRITVKPPKNAAGPETPRHTHAALPYLQKGGSIATRQSYGDGLAAIGAANDRVVAVDAEVSNSTYTEIFKKAHPERFFEMYIAEQQMIAAAVGMQVRGWIPFASTFGAFQSRAADFVRMAAISRANLKLCGSHAGVSIGEDGPSQMAIEDLSLMRAITGSTVFYPCDGNQTLKLVETMSDTDGISYIRTTREKTPIIYGDDESFPVGGAKVLRSSAADVATVVGAGVTVFEALKAYDLLKSEGVAIRVVDAYSVKPIDSGCLRKAASEAGGKIVVAEDHRPEGGLGDAVLDAFTDYDGALPRVTKLAVRELPTSGTPEELRAFAKIDAAAIVAAVKALID